jgi:hypothetical protein
MKKATLFLLAFAVLQAAFSQENHALQLSAGRSFHGTGDLPGLSLDVAYDHSFLKRLDLTTGLTTTIHSGKDRSPEFTFILPDQTTQTFKTPDRGMLRYTTAGVQLTSVLNYNFIARPRHKLRIGGGPVLRYESSSQPVGWGYTFNPNENELPVYTFGEFGNLHQLSVGYNLGFSYLFKISSRYQTGVRAWFQSDTNGSTITHLSLVFGRYLKFTD